MKKLRITINLYKSKLDVIYLYAKEEAQTIEHSGYPATVDICNIYYNCRELKFSVKLYNIVEEIVLKHLES